MEVDRAAHRTSRGVPPTGKTRIQHLANDPLRRTRGRVRGGRGGGASVARQVRRLLLGRVLRREGLRRDAASARLGVQFAEALHKALRACPTLMTLNLSANQLGAAGGKHVAEALAATRSLKLLDLSYNNLCGSDPPYGRMAQRAEAAEHELSRAKETEEELRREMAEAERAEAERAERAESAAMGAERAAAAAAREITSLRDRVTAAEGS